MITDHFLITRFNLKKADWDQDKNANKILDQDWLKKRIVLFKKYCLPSVVQQSAKNFRWLIVFQKEENLIINDLISLLNAYKFIETVFVNGYDDFLISLPLIIEERLHPGVQRVFSTRLDNDDAIHKDFIKEIQKEAITVKSKTVLHFPYGLCLDVGQKPRLAQQYHPLNQFITLVEDIEKSNIEGVYTNQHNKWGSNYAITAVRKDNLWLQITHGGNMMNTFTGVMAFTIKLNGFSIDKPSFSLAYNLQVLKQRLKKNLSNILK